MSRSRVSVAAAALLLAAVLAGPASATESTIYPGIGIGKIRLGMTRTQVAKTLGPSTTVDEHSRVSGAPYKQVGWPFSAWSVGFLRGRVVFVSTTLRTQRTPGGIGQGTTAQKLLKAYPNGLCGLKHALLYLVTQPSGTQTIFRFGWTYERLPSGLTRRVTRVDEVWVRTRFRPIEEFAPENRCPDGWEKPKIY